MDHDIKRMIAVLAAGLLMIAFTGVDGLRAQQEEPAPSVTERDGNPVPDAPEQITVSLDVKDVDVRDVLRALARQADANVSMTESVQGRVTIRLKDVPWDMAFETVVETAGLACRKQAGLIKVMTRAEAGPPEDESTDEQQPPAETGTDAAGTDTAGTDDGAGSQPEQVQVLEIPEPLETAVLHFQFVEAKAIQGAFQGLLGPDGFLALDEQNDTLIVTDTAARLDVMTALAARLDITPPKIQIEVLIADTILRDELDVGINWELSKINKNSEFMLAQELIDTAGGGGSVTYNKIGGRWTLDSFIRALEVFKNGRILATPRILVISGREASIETIEEIPYQELTQTSAGGQIGTTAFKEAGVKLIVTPKVTQDGLILLSVNAEQSASTDESINGVPVINTRKADTTLLLEDGETLVIGGLRRKETVKIVEQIPLLGDIPILGALFRYTSTQDENRDLVIFLTPRLVDDSELTGAERLTLAEAGFAYEPSGEAMEERLHGMAQDVHEGDIDGIRRRLADPSGGRAGNGRRKTPARHLRRQQGEI